MPLENLHDRLVLGEISEGLERLKEMQRVVSAQVPGFVHRDKVENDAVAITAFALMGEVFELAQELGWKRWKENPELTDEKRREIAEEFADILAFLGLLTYLVCKRANLTPDDLERAYWEKTEKNLRRFDGLSGEEGYGVFWNRIEKEII